MIREPHTEAHMDEYLIEVAIASTEDAEKRERTLYRVSPEAALKDVVETAKNRSELPGEVACTGLRVLGTIPSTDRRYPALLAPGDSTDADI